MDKIRGVNLGGWFVLEKWMKRDLFEGVSGPDETVFCKEKPNAKEILENHWKTFITEKDFAYLENIGINSVRIPIPWWLFGDAEPYFSCVTYLDNAMDLAKKHHLKVLLDLHTAPGCQNGFDNGGVTGVIDWPKSKDNIDLTIKILEKIALRYKNHEALWGIEVLNEPHFTIDLNLLQKFYLDSYHIIRKHINQAIVFHDSFRPDDPSWKAFFENNDLDNVYFDLHLYHCFDDKIANGKIEDQINVAIMRKDLIEKLSGFTKVIIGEWSLGLRQTILEEADSFNNKCAHTAIANTQLLIYEHAFGWYFWSYRVKNNHFSGWNFTKLVEEGYLPNKY